MGVFSLYFISGRNSIDMPSRSSEFIMVKDATRSRTGIIETDHNYFFPYQVFALYTLRIYRHLESWLKERFLYHFPPEYRFLLTEDFYNFVIEQNKEALQTLLGNDDILKYEAAEY